MGLSYTNMILYKVEQQPVVNFLRKQGRIAYVSSTQDNLTLVYAKETEGHNAKVIETFSKLLTKELSCIGLTTLVHDSDFWVYWLYRNGELLDLYNSLPYCTGGDPRKLCEAFDRLSAILEVQKVFRFVEQSNLRHEEFKAEDIHRVFVQALDIKPSLGIFIGYDMIENSDLPKELSRSNLIKTEG